MPHSLCGGHSARGSWFELETGMYSICTHWQVPQNLAVPAGGSVRIGLTMRLERTGPRCPRTNFHLSHPCFSSDAKRELSSRSVYVAAPVQMGFHSIPFITLHTHYRGHSHKGRVALRRPHHPHSSASRHRGQTGLDGVEGFIGFQLTQPVRPLCSLSSTFYVSLFLPSNATASFTLSILYPHSHTT